MFRKAICLVLSFLIVVPPLWPKEELEAGLPPSYIYSADQQDVIDQYGLPWQFNIVFQQVGKFRYETWYYGGTIKKKFGFVNGEKELETSFRGSLPDEARVTVSEPKDFTFTTKRGSLRQLFGPADKILKGTDRKLKQESHAYVSDGFGASFTKGKIDTVGTIPPLNSTARKHFASTLNVAESSVSLEPAEVLAGPPTQPDLIAAYAFVFACFLILAAVEALDESNDLEDAFLKYQAGKAILAALNADSTGKELQKTLISIFGTTQIIVEDSPSCRKASNNALGSCNNASLDYVNNLKDIKSTMKSTTAKSDLFPLTFHNQTDSTGKECGATGVAVQVDLDGASIGSIAPGRSLAKSVTSGPHTVQGCFAGNGCTGGATVKVPQNANWYFYWVCNNAVRSLEMSPR